MRKEKIAEKDEEFRHDEIKARRQKKKNGEKRMDN